MGMVTDDTDDDDKATDPPEVDAAGDPMPADTFMQTPAAAPQKSRGGRPRGSRNRTTVEREQAAATGVGAPTSRPAGRTGSFPGEEAKIPNDADLKWMYVLEEIAKEGFSPYDMEIRVDRKTPLPSVPMATFDATAVMGDASTSPATALRNYIIDWIHLPSGVQGPGHYIVHFCWRNKAEFFRRGELHVGSRNEVLAMKQAEQARQAQSGAAGVGMPHFVQQQQHQQQPQQFVPAPYYPGFGAPPPQQQTFDPDIERARIRAELEREMEITRMRQELDELRRRPPQYAPPPYGYPSGSYTQPTPGPQRRGAGAPPPPQPQYEEDPDARTARVVVAVLQQYGVVPRQPGAGVGAPPAAPGDAIDNLERALEVATRTKKVLKRAHDLFEGDEEQPKAKGVGAPAEEEEEAAPKVRFQPTGQKYKGHETMMPVDKDGDPIFPTTLPMILATGIANPGLMEPVMQGVGAILSQGAGMLKGLGNLGQQQQPQRADIHVQQVQQQQPQSAPAPTPYYPPAPQVAASPAPADDGGWDLS